MITDPKAIERYLGQCLDIFVACVIEEFTEWARRDDEYLRANDGFNNQSGNLRSSIGAAVVKNAETVFETSFATVLNGSLGSSDGRRAVERLRGGFKDKIAKVVVAGMSYADYVENIDSKDVLESRRIQCDKEARSIIERAMQKADIRIKALR